MRGAMTGQMYYAGSPALSMEFRLYYLVKEWIRQGHTVLIT
jgi:hypothetical protein